MDTKHRARIDAQQFNFEHENEVADFCQRAQLDKSVLADETESAEYNEEFLAELLRILEGV